LSLTLDCVCPGADIGVCELTALTFVVSISETLFGSPTIEADHTLVLYANPDDPSAPTITISEATSAELSFDLPLADWADLWTHYVVELTTVSSALQVPVPAFSAYDKIWATYYIRQDYLCTNGATSANTHPVANAYTKDPQDFTQCETSPGDLRCVCYAGQGVGSLFYKSSPLGLCNGCVISDQQFEPVVDAAAKVDINSGNWCLCATGGSGNYSYGLGEGQLPCGLSLDPTSGCITGVANGKCAGTPLFKFNVLDLSSQETATVTCGALGNSCSSGTSLGNQAY
jgi:hypothetical protein